MQAVSKGQSSFDSPFGFEGCSLIAVAKKKARITARNIKGIISQVSKEVVFFANNFKTLFSFFFQSKCCTKTRFKSHFWCEKKAYFVVIAYLFRLHCVWRILSFFGLFSSLVGVTKAGERLAIEHQFPEKERKRVFREKSKQQSITH